MGEGTQSGEENISKAPSSISSGVASHPARREVFVSAVQSYDSFRQPLSHSRQPRGDAFVSGLHIQAVDARGGIVNDLAARLFLEPPERFFDKFLRARPARGSVRIV